MKVLIIDKDALSCQLLQTRLNDRGCDVTCEPDKNAALDLLKETDYDVIMLDPTPVQDARPIIISIYKTIRGRYEPQFLVLSKTIDQEAALAAGANDLVSKPVSPQALEEKMLNMERLIKHTHQLAQPDSHEALRGVINKEAFNELFLSAIDRSHRYAERSFVVFIEIKTDKKTFEALSNRIRYIRRQSDVIGRTGVHEFGILLQRPIYESEPFDATTRFTEVLSQHVSELDGAPDVEIDLRLVEIPIGQRHIHTRVTPQETSVIAINENY